MCVQRGKRWGKTQPETERSCVQLWEGPWRGSPRQQDLCPRSPGLSVPGMVEKRQRPWARVGVGMRGQRWAEVWGP